MKDTGDNDDHFYVVPSEKIKNKTLQKNESFLFGMSLKKLTNIVKL